MDKYSVLKKIDKYLEEKDYINARKLIRNDLKRYGTKERILYVFGLCINRCRRKIKKLSKSN